MRAHALKTNTWNKTHRHGRRHRHYHMRMVTNKLPKLLEEMSSRIKLTKQSALSSPDLFEPPVAKDNTGHNTVKDTCMPLPRKRHTRTDAYADKRRTSYCC